MHEEVEKISYKICAFCAHENLFRVVDSHMIGNFVFKLESKSRDTSRKIEIKYSDLRLSKNDKMHEEGEKISYKICAFYAQESWFQIVDSHMIGKFVFKSESKSRDTSRKIWIKNSDL